MTSTRSASHRWLLIADLCAIVLATLTSDEVGLVKGLVGRSMLLLAAGVYLMLTALTVYLLTRRSQATPTLRPAEPASQSLLGKRGPAFLAYIPRFLMGAGLLAYALWLRR